MRARQAVSAIAVAAVLAGVPGGADSEEGKRSALPGRTYSWTFAADTLGLPPQNTRAAGGTWAVLEDSSAASAAVRIVRQLESDDGIASHALQFLKPSLADQEVSVRVRIRSGDIDPSVGVAFQLDPRGRNGYLIRVSGRSRELLAHYLLGGRRRDLKYVRLDPPRQGEWHTLGVRRIGSVMEVRYDGEVKMRLRDERFGSGNVGLWTEDDTVADFADLTVRSL